LQLQASQEASAVAVDDYAGVEGEKGWPDPDGAVLPSLVGGAVETKSPQAEIPIPELYEEEEEVTAKVAAEVIVSSHEQMSAQTPLSKESAPPGDALVTLTSLVLFAYSHLSVLYLPQILVPLSHVLVKINHTSTLN
jgi:hypothetical protein